MRPPQQVAPSIALDDEDDAGPSLELAVAPRQTPSVRPMPAAVRAAGQGGGEQVPPARASIPPPRRPMGSLPPPAEGVREANAYEVARVADFGDVPGQVWESPFYALRVFNRVRELKAETLALREEVKTHEQALDEALVVALDEARPELMKDSALARHFEPLRDLQPRYDEQLAQVEAVDAQGQQELRAIDEELAQHERTAQQGRSTHDGLTSEAARLFESSRAGDALAGQLLDAIRAQMQQAETETTQAIARMTDLRRQRRELEQGYITRLRAMDEELAFLQKPRRVALLEVGRSLLERRSALEHPAFRPVDLARRRFEQSSQRLRLFEAASTSFDRRKVQEGVLVLVVLLVVLLVAVGLGVMRMNRELSAPPPVLPPL